MTVIAYRDGVLAGDGRVTMKEFIDDDNYRKVLKLADGSLVGTAGHHTNGLKLLALLQRLAKEKLKKKKNPLPNIVVKGVEVILVDPSGDVWWYGDGGWERIKVPFYAIGSGGGAAICAMEAGASAVEACQIAKKRISSCGGRIRKVEL